MTTQFVNTDALDGQHFIGVRKNSGSTELQVRISQDIKNGITVRNDGLFATKEVDGLPSAFIRTYTIPDDYFPNSLRNTSTVTVDKKMIVYGNMIIIKMKVLKGVVSAAGWELQNTQKIWPANLTGSPPLNISWQGKTTSSGDLVLNGVNRWAWTGAAMEASLMAAGNGITIVENPTVPADFTLVSEVSVSVGNQNTTPQISAKVNNLLSLEPDGLYSKRPEGNALVGPGRPDKPTTTNGIIKGTEDNGLEYISTDGAGTGAWRWLKTNGKWSVVIADTGWRKIEISRFRRGYVRIRRINNEVRMNIGGGLWDGVEVNNFDPSTASQYNRIDLTQVPEGFRTKTTSVGFLTYDNYINIGYFVATAISDGNLIQFRNETKPDARYKDIVRSSELSYFTDQDWPESLTSLPAI